MNKVDQQQQQTYQKEFVELLFRHSWDAVYEVFIIYYGPNKSLNQLRRKRILRALNNSFGIHFKRRHRKPMSKYIRDLDNDVRLMANEECFEYVCDETSFQRNWHVSHIGTLHREKPLTLEKYQSILKSFCAKGIVDECTSGNIP